MFYLTVIGAAFLAWLILVTLTHSDEVVADRLGRSTWEKLVGTVAWILERQQ